MSSKYNYKDRLFKLISFRAFLFSHTVNQYISHLMRPGYRASSSLAGEEMMPNEEFPMPIEGCRA